MVDISTSHIYIILVPTLRPASGLDKKAETSMCCWRRAPSLGKKLEWTIVLDVIDWYKFCQRYKMKQQCYHTLDVSYHTLDVSTHTLDVSTQVRF